MYVKRFSECKEIPAGDHTRLRELLHPDRDPIEARYSLAIARLGPGEKSLAHRLKQSEVYYIIKGQGMMHVGRESARVKAGDAVYIPPDVVQRLENTGREVLEFACIVDPAWQPEGEEVFGSG